MQKKYRIEVAEPVENWLKNVINDSLSGEFEITSLERIYSTANSLRIFPYRIKEVDDESLEFSGLRKIQADKKYFIYFKIDDTSATVNILAVTFAKGEQASQVRSFIEV